MFAACEKKSFSSRTRPLSENYPTICDEEKRDGLGLPNYNSSQKQTRAVFRSQYRSRNLEYHENYGTPETPDTPLEVSRFFPFSHRGTFEEERGVYLKIKSKKRSSYSGLS